MRWIKWGGILAAIMLIIACFMVWVSIPSKSINVSGVDSTGTSFGKPGYLHLLLAPIFIYFSLLPKLWAKRSNLAVVAINSAWAFRNFFIISTCQAGICPEKKAGIYLVLIMSMLMLVAALLPDMRVRSSGSAIEKK